MFNRKSLNRLFSTLVVVSLLVGGSVQVQAQSPAAPDGVSQTAKDKDKNKITHNDRKAVAVRNAAAGLTVEAMAAAGPALPGETPRYFTHPNYANSPLPVVDPITGAISGGLRKFVDEIPMFGTDIPIAVADRRWPEFPTYEIGLVQYVQQMHTDLASPTLLRGYVQLTPCTEPGAVPLSNVLRDGVTTVSTGYCGVTAPIYLGPAIVTLKDTPVRIIFRNLLPDGLEGNLFIPVDTTVMGSGPTADGHMIEQQTNPPPPAPWNDPQIPACSRAGKADQNGLLVDQGLCYAENRATLHLHGGISPWISDGTPHQWITPAGGNAEYPQGVSVQNVPDMNMCDGADDGCQTFYYTNQQSARLMFYHDHAWGITRLNVYAGEAAAYVITDPTEAALQGTIPGPLDPETIYLVIQDKTFLPSPAQVAMQDETWDYTRWGDEGDLWLPHVYSPAQNPGDVSGVNQFGRWAYGPWFWPPTTDIKYGPISPNPYYCDPGEIPGTDCVTGEPYEIPGVPYLSMGMESFHDTPIVNGMAYPTIELDPVPTRLRILSAANDRFFNLSLYKAVDFNGALCDLNTNPYPAPESTGVACTEVALNPVEVAAALTDPAGVFPTPVAGTEGPDWIQFGSEGGFLPSPVVIPPQYITWVTDPTVFNAGNVDQHSLLLGPAERADVVVDLRDYAGQTLILYNDAPAAFPARDPRYDYYTGNADLQDTGGTPSTLRGYGPNTRTVMQIKVRNIAPTGAFTLAALQAAFAHNATNTGVFERGQHPIIVGQSEYNSAYGTNFAANGPFAGVVQIYNTALTFNTLPPVPGNPALGTLTMSLRPKQIQDEMGEAFEREYGRMSGFLGVETPNAQAGLQNMVLYPYVDPPTEIIDGVEVTGGTDTSLPFITPIASANDGTQIWKITHNGVDTHPIHFHLYEVQLINRVGWDGVIRKPDLNELGWKDTVRISPLEDTIVALRPIIPHIPTAWNGLPNSIRLLDPSLHENMYIANTTQQEALGLPIFAFNPDGEPIDIINHYINFGWEYVWHCHILSHEEMDMMRSQVVGVAPAAPGPVTVTQSGSGNQTRNNLTWMDNSRNETAFVIERSSSATGPWSYLATVGWSINRADPTFANAAGTGLRTYSDRVGRTGPWFYQVYAINTVGDTWDYSNPAFNEIPPGGGFPRLVLDSRGGSTSSVATPTGLTASAAVKSGKTATVTLKWTQMSDNETGFLIQRADNAGFSLNVVNATVGADVTTFNQNVARGKTFFYRVLAFNNTFQSGWSNTASVTTP